MDEQIERVRRLDVAVQVLRHLAEAAARRAELLGAALAGWPAEDLERLIGYLDRLNDSVVRHLPGL
ncbi:MAG: hypothetical protein ACRDP6_48165 [Actinoallomurus sp.]